MEGFTVLTCIVDYSFTQLPACLHSAFDPCFIGGWFNCNL